MAQLVTARANSPDPTANHDGPVPFVASATFVLARSIPLDLAPLLLPYKKNGRLGLRIEQLQQRARLSRGRNNGNGSWSLASDELEDLAYQPPEGIAETRSLTIRIIALDQEGTTLAVLDFPLLPGRDQARPVHKAGMEKACATNPLDKAQLRPQNDALEALKSALAASESELAEARWTTENAKTGSFQTMEAALAAAEAGWKIELEERLAKAAAQAAADLAQCRDDWEAENGASLAKAEEKAQSRLAEARKRWQRKAEDAISSAETAWKADETARMAAAEVEWKEKSRKVLAETRKQAAAARDGSDGIETNRLREQLADMAAMLAHRNSALAQARLAAANAREHWQAELETTLSNAEKSWKEEEASRLAAAEELWREQSVKSFTDATARWEAAEASLARARAEIAAAASDKIELCGLRTKLETMAVTLADRDTALDQTRLAAEQTREAAQKESAMALANAKVSWEAGTDSRLEAAEAQWRQRFANALAEATTRFENAEIALAQVRVRTEAARAHTDEDTVNHLNEELATLRVMLADRDRELVQARLTPGAREFPAQQARIALRSDREWDAIEPAPRHGLRITPRLVRDIALAGALAASVIIFYPRVVALVPESSQANIEAITAGLETAFNGPTLSARSPAPASHDVAAKPLAVIVHAANLRTRSSASASIISTLRLGIEVATIQQQGNWTLVRVDDKNSHAGPRLGWVYSPFLKGAGADNRSRTTSNGIHL